MTTAKTPSRTARPRRGGNLWLAVLAVLQAGVLAWVLLTVARPPTVAVGPLLDVDLDTVTALTLDDADGASLALAKAGADWVLPNADDYPADPPRVQALLDKIAGLTRNGLVAASASSYPRLQVADDAFVRKIEVGFADGTSRTLLIGSSPSYGSTHVRIDGDPGVYLVRDLRDTDARTDANAWIVQTVTDIPTADVTGLELRNGNGTFTFRKVGADWTMDGLEAGETLSPDAVTRMVDRLASLRVHAPVGKEVKPEYGLDDPAAVLTLTSQAAEADAGVTTDTRDAGKGDAAAADDANDDAAGGAADEGAAQAGDRAADEGAVAAAPVVTTVTVGAEDGDGNRYVRVSSSPFVLTTSGANLAQAAEKALGDFLVEPDAADPGN